MRHREGFFNVNLQKQDQIPINLQNTNWVLNQVCITILSMIGETDNAQIILLITLASYEHSFCHLTFSTLTAIPGVSNSIKS